MVDFTKTLSFFARMSAVAVKSTHWVVTGSPVYWSVAKTEKEDVSPFS